MAKLPKKMGDEMAEKGRFSGKIRHFTPRFAQRGGDTCYVKLPSKNQGGYCQIFEDRGILAGSLGHPCSRFSGFTLHFSGISLKFSLSS